MTKGHDVCPTCKRRMRKPKLDYEKARQLYELGHTFQEIGRIFSCSTMSAWRAVKRCREGKKA